MAHRPLIGVVPLWDDKLNSLWMLPGYFDGIIEAGGIPVMLPLTDDETTIEQLVSQCDGFLVTGGHDDPVVHEVSIAPDSPLARALWPLGDNGPSEAEADEVDSFGRPYHPRAYTLGVNSYHHQAIRTLGQGLEPMATAPDGIVEAVWMPAKRFVWAVQWHPEFSHRADSNQRRILSAFIDAC